MFQAESSCKECVCVCDNVLVALAIGCASTGLFRHWYYKEIYEAFWSTKALPQNIAINH